MNTTQKFAQTSFLPYATETRKARTSRETERALLMERFATARSFDSFTETETLKALINCSANRNDAEQIAADLLDTFGSLKAVLEARPEALIKVRGCGMKTAMLISMMVPVAKTWERLALEQPERVGNCREAEKYCRSLLSGERNEHFYVIALNAQCQVLGKRRISEGSLSEVSAYPRSVVETAINYNAHSILLAHNHPGGTCAPSREDISSTVQLQRVLSALNILVLDHIIVAGANTYSMIQHGDIDYRVK